MFSFGNLSRKLVHRVGTPKFPLSNPIIRSLSAFQYSIKLNHLLFFKHQNKCENRCSYSDIPNQNPQRSISSVEYEKISEETLQSLTECFEDMLETTNLKDFDVDYSNDVLTVSLNDHGTYVINKQSPNKQIWLSSPVSGPKRYDFIKGTWIYNRDGISLYQLLSKEMSNLLHKDCDFESCSYGKILK